MWSDANKLIDWLIGCPLRLLNFVARCLSSRLTRRWDSDDENANEERSDGHIRIAIRFKSLLTRLLRLDLTASLFHLNTRDSTGISFEIHLDSIWDSAMNRQIAIQYQNCRRSAVSVLLFLELIDEWIVL